MEASTPTPALGRTVIYRSRTGAYDLPAIINCTRETLQIEGVEKGHVPMLASPRHVHLTVFSPGKPGLRGTAQDFVVQPTHGAGISENVSGCYQEWDIPEHVGNGAVPPGSWRWPPA
jgi:hypothetical protein